VTGKGKALLVALGARGNQQHAHCQDCEAKNEVIVALQHVIRDLRDRLGNEQALGWLGTPR
jgi:hypothetical protein